MAVGKPLTEKHRQFLAFIVEGIAAGKLPTYREIMKHFGWTSVGSVARNLDALERRGILSKAKGKSRWIRLADDVGQVRSRATGRRWVVRMVEVR